MRLIRCHIDGFGKLKDADFAFESGLNIFLEGNGWGKSTLAAFLRVMLYGFDGEGKRNDLENERRKYLPWATSSYGGSLTFSVNDKNYILYRTFGERPKDDTFSLFDENNLKSSDFSEKIGEELFQIDQVSFKRTAFMGQMDLDTGDTGSISAKLSNLCEDTDDLNNFEKVRDFLTRSLNNLSPSRSTGAISGINSEISRLKVEVQDKDQVERSIDELTIRINDKIASATSFEEELKKLKSIESRLIKHERHKAYLDQKAELVNNLKAREGHLESLKATAPGGVPDGSTLEEAGKVLRHLNNMELQLAENKVTEAEAERVEELDTIFANGIPEEEEMREAESKLKNINALSERFDAAETELRSLQEAFTKEMHAMGARLNRIRFRRVFGAVIFLVFAAALGILFMNKQAIPEGAFKYCVWGVAGLGLVSLIIFTVIIEISYRRASRMPSSEERDKKEAEVLDIKGRLESVRNELSTFLSRYHMADRDTEAAVALNELLHDRAEYLKLSDKVTYAEKNGILSEMEATRHKLQTFFENTGMFLTGDFQSDLQNLMVLSKEMENAEIEIKAAKDRLEAFDQEASEYEDYDNVADITDMTVTDVRSEIERIESSIGENEKIVTQEEKRRNELLEELAELNEKCDLLDEKKEQAEALKCRYNIYGNTLKFMEAAHNALNSRLLTPLSESFRSHLSEMGYTLAGNDAGKVYVDSHADITIEEAGRRHELKYFSAGTRDLMSLAMRIALLDNMYSYEKPFIVMDDPFVNLDQTRMSVAKDFLQKISNDYQIVYFTCRGEFI